MKPTLFILFLLSSIFSFGVNYTSSGNNTWAGSGFPNPVVAGDTVFIQNADTITLDAKLSIDGVVVIDTLCLVSGGFDIDIETTGHLRNDIGGTINITEELHVDGFFYNSRNTFADKLHNDGYVCNSGTIVLTDKFDHHGGILECCGNLIVDVFKVHDNGGTPATTNCQNICSTDSMTNPTFETITELEFLTNGDPGNSLANLSNTTLCELGALPITLVKFEAHPNGDAIDLKWITASEINNDYFTIERSTDGINWEPITTIAGAGNSTSIIHYFEKDYNPLNNISYYRLKQTDFDGQYSYSHVVPVKFSTNETISLFPNPVQKGYDLTIDLTKIDGQEILVVLRDIVGREYYSKVIMNVDEHNLVAIPVSNEIPAGVYLIITSSNDVVYSQKLLVK